MAIEVYHLDAGIYVRINCNTDVSTALGRYIMIKKEDGTVAEVAAEQDPYSTTHIRYLIPASSSPFITAPAGKDFVTYWMRPRIVFSSSFPLGQQGKPVRFDVGRSWAVSA